MLEMDSTIRLIPAAERAGLVAMALRTGREWAHELRGRYPEADSLLLAQELGVEVEFSDQENEAGMVTLRSEYYATVPARIVVYNSSIEKLKEVVGQAGLTGVIEPSLLMPIHVTHELFHHVENWKQDHLSQRYKVATLRIGRWRLIESGVRALTEIGAHAFVEGWLRLGWFPLILDQIEILARGEAKKPVERWNEFVKKRGGFGWLK